MMTDECPSENWDSRGGQADKTKVVVLLSGGLDSSACLKFYLDLGFHVSALFVDYGHAAARAEMAAANSIASHYGVKLNCIRCLDFPLSGEGFIQGRNAFLLFCALMVLRNSGMIAIGIHSGTSYADCTPDFVELMQRTFDLYTQGTIRIVTPFLLWDKAKIWHYSLDRGVPISKTYSCEEGLSVPCGHCLSCKDMKSLQCS
jgi:7-cyano-7-deazaguanine synthase